MAKVSIVNWEKAEVGELDINEQLIDTPYHPYVIKDAVVQYQAELRQGTHSTKTRSEVAGGGRKPWRQKGTGRARAGTASSPIWRHGGIVFGPQPRDHSISINKKVRKKALRSALAEKIRNQQVFVLDEVVIDEPKTKLLKQKLSNFEAKNVLIVVDEVSKNISLAARNLKEVEVINYRSLNVYKLLYFEKVVFAKNALTAVEQRLLS